MNGRHPHPPRKPFPTAPKPPAAKPTLRERLKRCTDKLWPEMADGETKVTTAGFEEKRSTVYITGFQFRSAMNRIALAFVVLGAVASFSAWLSFDAGRRQGAAAREAEVVRSEDRIRAAHASVIATCRSGVELRLTTAAALETLRTQAISSSQRGISRADQLAFIRQTQEPIDDLLSQSAGREYHAPIPPGAVTRAVEREVGVLAEAKCQARAEREWPLPKPKS